MKANHLVLPLVLISSISFGGDNHALKSTYTAQTPFTLIKTYSNEATDSFKLMHRSMEYPTQIIRIIADVKSRQLTCDQVNAEIENVLLNHITKDQFAYSTFISCSFDPQTEYATKYEINSHFDPLNDTAITYLKSYLEAYNGFDLMGTKLKIESAKGVIVSIDTAAGTKKNPENPPFVQYRQDHSHFFFKSNYELSNTLFADANENFLTNDPQKIFPFLNRWVFDHASVLYKAVLRDSNYAELNPERVFLMDNKGDIFVSKLRFYFSHDCREYDNHRCLKDS